MDSRGSPANRPHYSESPQNLFPAAQPCWRNPSCEALRASGPNTLSTHFSTLSRCLGLDGKAVKCFQREEGGKSHTHPTRVFLGNIHRHGLVSTLDLELRIHLDESWWETTGSQGSTWCGSSNKASFGIFPTPSPSQLLRTSSAASLSLSPSNRAWFRHLWLN